MNIHEQYMHLCLTLAGLGAGNVAPNPMVGAVLVYKDKIIGEGYHARYGEAHAEVNCLASVKSEDEQFISKSTLYVSLEPCAHYAKTPPCADLIISKNISKVVVGCRDPFKEVNGKGIEKLQRAGVKVELNILKEECKQINKRFFTFHIKQRPYVILKWAQSQNAKIAKADFSRVSITNEITNRLVHKWRSEEGAIMIGTNTALYDDPSLNVRLWAGPNPTRLVVDMNLRLPLSLKILDKQQDTIIFNSIMSEEHDSLKYIRLNKDEPLVTQIVKCCFDLQIQSVLIEGGSKLTQSFINENIWDEARVIENHTLIIEDGIQAPTLFDEHLISKHSIFNDLIFCYRKNSAIG